MKQEAAYYHWLNRGCPYGSPEVDWFAAEEQQDTAKSAVITVAEAVGSALGSAVTTLKHILQP